MEICAVYKITNTITGDFYIGSSKNVKRRWRSHKCKYNWKKYPNNPMYQDMQKYGLDKFVFEIIEIIEIIEEVEADKLKETEQQFIEKMHPTYNNYYAKGLDVERKKEYNKEYRKTNKCKEWHKSNKGKESHRKASNKYGNQLCSFNCETLTLGALSKRFERQGIDHPTQEAKKYLIKD